MNEETSLPPSRDEARAALAQIEDTRSEIRKSIAQSMAGPSLIMWGVIWMIMLSYAQFHTGENRLWWVFVVAGFLGSWSLPRFYPTPIKRKPDARIGAFWLVIFAYAVVLLILVEPWNLLVNLSPADAVMMGHKICAYYSIIPMMAYVLFGLWIGRFFVWLGLLVTALILLGFYFIPDYFYLWVAVTGGGALMLSGIFIRKFWK